MKKNDYESHGSFLANLVYIFYFRPVFIDFFLGFLKFIFKCNMNKTLKHVAHTNETNTLSSHVLLLWTVVYVE